MCIAMAPIRREAAPQLCSKKWFRSQGRPQLGQREDSSTMDFLFIAILCALALSSWGLVSLCERV